MAKWDRLLRAAIGLPVENVVELQRAYRRGDGDPMGAAGA